MGLFARHKILLPIISMKMSLIISERKTDLLIPVTQFTWLCNSGHHEEDTLQELKAIWRHRMSFGSNVICMRYTDKKTYQEFNRPMPDAIRKSKRRRRLSHCMSNLRTPTHDSTYISIVNDMLFINVKFNMIKWL